MISKDRNRSLGKLLLTGILGLGTAIYFAVDVAGVVKDLPGTLSWMRDTVVNAVHYVRPETGAIKPVPPATTPVSPVAAPPQQVEPPTASTEPAAISGIIFAHYDHSIALQPVRFRERGAAKVGALNMQSRLRGWICPGDVITALNGKPFPAGSAQEVKRFFDETLEQEGLQRLSYVAGSLYGTAGEKVTSFTAADYRNADRPARSCPDLR